MGSFVSVSDATLIYCFCSGVRWFILAALFLRLPPKWVIGTTLTISCGFCHCSQTPWTSHSLLLTEVVDCRKQPWPHHSKGRTSFGHKCSGSVSGTSYVLCSEGLETVASMRPKERRSTWPVRQRVAFSLVLVFFSEGWLKSVCPDVWRSPVRKSRLKERQVDCVVWCFIAFLKHRNITSVTT